MSDLDGSLYSNNVGVIITLTLLVVIIKPIIVIITGSLTNIKSRTAFLGGVTTNQAATSSHEESLELYDAGARYVIQTEFLAARGFREILDGEMGKSDKDAFRDLGQTHREETKKLQEGLGEIFAKA